MVTTQDACINVPRENHRMLTTAATKGYLQGVGNRRGKDSNHNNDCTIILSEQERDWDFS